MKKRDRKALSAYIRSIADQLGLSDWNLNLLREPCGDDYNAQVRIIYGRKVADIRVSAEFRGFDLERVRRTVVHELIHLHFAACTQALDVFFSAWLRDFEYGIDWVATTIAPRLPLIVWP